MTHDLIVIGAGFAGAVAARDAAKAGRTVLVLEGRDRIGGRTWYRAFAGADGREHDQHLEIGGTWIAPEQQPYVGAEVERYGLDLFQSPSHQRFAWGVGGEVVETSFPIPVEEWPAFERALSRINADADRIRLFEEPLGQEGLDDLDIPFTDYVDALDLPPISRDFLLAWPAFYFGAYPEKLSALHVISWTTGFGSNVGWYSLLVDKVDGGTSALLRRILDDSGAEVRLGVDVARIADNGDRVEITTRGGETFAAERVVVTAPINTWDRIEFSPPLPASHAAMATEKQAGESVKVWALVPALDERNLFGVGLHTVFKWIAAEYTTDEGTYLCCFASAEADLDGADREAVERAVREYLPEAELLDHDWHDWNRDEFSKGTWMAYRPGQVMAHSAAIQQPYGRIHFAGSDLASGWAGWIDGAIESGGRAAAQVEAAFGD